MTRKCKNWALLLSLCFFGVSAAADECARDLANPFERLQIGLQLESALPNQLPDFSSGILLYGLTVTQPILSEVLVLGGEYGTLQNFSIYRFDVGLRHIFHTPFIVTYLEATVFQMKYSQPGSSHSYWGPAFAFGVALPMDSIFTIQFQTKMVLASRPLFNIGGGFLLAL